MLRSGLALSGQPQASSRSRPGGLAAKSQSEYEAEGQEKQLYGPADDVAVDLPALKPGDQGFQINMAACIRAYKKKKAESESLKAQIKKKKGECSKLTSSARPRKKQEIAALQEKLEELEAEVSLLGQRIGPVREAFDNQDKFKEREERRQRDKDLLKMKHRSISVSSGDESAAPSSRYSVSLGPNPSPSQSPVAPSGSPGLLTEIKALESPTLRPHKLVFSADEIEDIDPKEKVKARKSVKAKETSLFVFAEEDFPVLPAPATQGAPPGKPVTSVTVGALSASAPRAPCSPASGSPPCVSGMETGKCVSKPSYLAESSGKGIIACTVIPSVLSHPALYTQVPTTPSIPSSPTDTGKSKTVSFGGKIKPGEFLPTSPMIPSDSFEATENSAICTHNNIPRTVVPSVPSHQDAAQYTKVPTTPIIPSEAVNPAGTVFDQFEDAVDIREVSGRKEACFSSVPTTPIILSCSVIKTVEGQFEDAADIRGEEVSDRKVSSSPIIISSPAAGTVSRRSEGVISTVEGELCDRQLRNILTTTPMIPCGVSDLVAIQKDTETRGRGTVKNTFTKKSVTLVGSGEVVGKAPPNVNPTALSLSPEQGHRSVLYPQVIIIKAKQPPANEGAPKAPVNVVSVADGSAVRSVGGMAVPVPEVPGMSVPNTVPVRSVGLNPVGGMAAGVGEPVPEVPAEPGVSVPNTVPVRSVGLNPVGGMAVPVSEVPGISVPNTVPVRSVGLNPVGGMAAGVGEPVPEVPAEPGITVPNTVPVNAVSGSVGDSMVRERLTPGTSQRSFANVTSTGSFFIKGSCKFLCKNSCRGSPSTSWSTCWPGSIL
ncbi:hypothetical protein XENTR_v10004725 [Xenopus tropicalis]|nr:hypothetical protein XENTR_v10004725 [Xenopus tropicalis]